MSKHYHDKPDNNSINVKSVSDTTKSVSDILIQYQRQKYHYQLVLIFF